MDDAEERKKHLFELILQNRILLLGVLLGIFGSIVAEDLAGLVPLEDKFQQIVFHSFSAIVVTAAIMLMLFFGWRLQREHDSIPDPEPITQQDPKKKK